jgi:S1-C subfamily serine protease
MRVLVAPPGTSSEAVFDRLRAWSGAGMLHPFCWREAPVGEPIESSVDVRLVDRGQVREVSLSEALDRTVPAEFALVGVCAATAGEGFDERFHETLSACVTAAMGVVPFAQERPIQASIVVAPAEIGQRVPPGLFRPKWAACLYVAPEDRGEPNDPNHLAGNEQIFPAHAAHAVMTLVDGWIDQARDGESVLQALARRQPQLSPARVQVARSFSRAIDYGYLADHVSATIFHAGESWPNPNRDRFERLESTDALTPRVVGAYMKQHAGVLGLSKFEPIPMPEREELGLLEALRRLIREIIARLRRKPFDWAEEKLIALHDRAADRIERMSGGELKVKHWGKRVPPDGRLLDLTEHLERPLAVPGGAVGPAWTDLRMVALGLVDGSPLPPAVDEVVQLPKGRRAVVTEPGRIVPEPTLPLPVLEGLPAPTDDDRVCDPLRLDPAFARERVGDEAEEGLDIRPALAEWAEPHQKTPIWRIGFSIARDLRTARSEAAAPPPPPAVESPEAAEQRRQDSKERGRHLRRSILLSTLAAAVAAALVWVYVPLIPRIPALAGVAILWLFSLAVAARNRWRADEEALRAILERQLTVLNAALLRAQRLGDEIRLEKRYREFLDWAEMTGWFVHRPWLGKPLGQVDLAPRLDVATLPAAVEVAVGEVTDQDIMGLANRSGRDLFQPGWLAGIYETVEGETGTEAGLAEGLDEVQAKAELFDPAGDTDGPDSDLRLMRTAVRNGNHRAIEDNPLSRGLLAFIDGIPLDGLARGVRMARPADGATDAQPVDALPPAAAWFEPPENLRVLLAALRPTVVRVEVRTADGTGGGTGVVIDGQGLVATARHVVDGATEVVVVLPGGGKLDAEVRHIAPDTDLAVIAVTTDGELQAVTLAPETRELEQGQPVVTLGHPKLLSGDATFGWGLVTATRRQIHLIDPPPGLAAIEVVEASYNAAAGASGSPVFDLDGRLVAIHCAGAVELSDDPRAAYLSCAVPVRDLRGLLQSGGTPVPSSSEPAAAPRARRREGLQTASAFLSELFDVDPGLALLPQHWASRNGAHEIEETMPQAPVSLQVPRKPPLDVDYTKPLRVLAHRVELAHSVPAEELVSCAGE